VGTNPSVLEAMASNTLIIANNNIFNKSILEDNAHYFDNSNDIKEILNQDILFANKEIFATANIKKINELFSWDIINSSYEKYILNKIK
jgi:glycosyltransferase involved in cell wall biosynthesis